MDKRKELDLQKKATQIRKYIIEEVFSAKSGHPGGSLSCTDILTVLYFDEMNVDPKNPKSPTGTVSCFQRALRSGALCDARRKRLLPGERSVYVP